MVHKDVFSILMHFILIVQTTVGEHFSGIGGLQ